MTSVYLVFSPQSVLDEKIRRWQQGGPFGVISLVSVSGFPVGPTSPVGERTRVWNHSEA